MSPPKPSGGMPAPPELIHQRADAMAVFLVPDVCKTPVGPSMVPIPYPAIGLASTGMGFSTTVKANGLPFKHKGSKFSKTMGDEAGVGLGVKSSTVMGLVEPVMSSRVVSVEGQPVIRHGDKCTLNSGNTLGEYIHIKDILPVVPPSASDDDAGGGGGGGGGGPGGGPGGGSGGGGGGGSSSWSWGPAEVAGIWEGGAATGISGGAPTPPSGPGFEIRSGLDGVRCTKG